MIEGSVRPRAGAEGGHPLTSASPMTVSAIHQGRRARASRTCRGIFRTDTVFTLQTGMRVGELHALEWGDVDEAGSRFRVKAGKTAAARRWVALPDDLMADIAVSVAREQNP